MVGESRYPFRLTNAFFSTLDFRRLASAVDVANVDVTIEMRVHTNRLPDRLQIDLKLQSGEDDPLTLLVELIALFDLLEGQPEPDLELVQAFINDRALFMLFPLIRDVVYRTSASMGMKPLEIQIPYHFDFRFDELAEEEE